MANILDTNRQIVEAIRNLAFSACCPDIPLTEQPTQDTDILPGVGEPPATWGTEPVTDWDDWERLVCGYANGWVDRQIHNANLIQTLITTGTLTVALIVGIMYVAGLLVISMGTAAGIWGGLGSLYGTFVFSSAATAFTDNRDEIICKIKNDVGVGEFRDYMESIIPPLAWAGFYTWLDYQHIVNSIWEGQNPDGSLEVTRMDCPTCGDNFDFDITLTPEMTPERWSYNRAGPVSTGGWHWGHNPRSSLSDSFQEITLGNAKEVIVTSLNPVIEMIEVDVQPGTSYLPKTVALRRYFPGGAIDDNELTLANGVRTTVRWNVGVGGQTYPGGAFMSVRGLHNGNNQDGQGVHNVKIFSVRIAGRLEEPV